jgi:hypothetical protein
MSGDDATAPPSPSRYASEPLPGLATWRCHTGIVSTHGQPQGQDWIAVGDPLRPALRRGVLSVLFSALAFFVFTVPTKQIASLYDHAPWRNDPYDAVYTLAMFLVPLLVAQVSIPLALCRASERLAISRVTTLRRGGRLVLALMTATVASCWASVAAQANRSQWNDATSVLVAGLVVVTLLVMTSAVELRRVARLAPVKGADWPAGPDLIGELVSLVEGMSRRIGAGRTVVSKLLFHVERRALPLLRRHPIESAAVAAIVFGVGVASNQGIAEHYAMSGFLLTGSLLGCGMFAFLVVAGNYLGLVRSDAHLTGLRRRLIDALVGACIGSVGALAFRDSLWWLVGTTATGARIAQLATLVVVVALVFFFVILTSESLARVHSPAR